MSVFHIAVTKNYYRNLFLMGLIIFVSLIEIHTLQYVVFIGVLFMQMYKLKMDKKMKYKVMVVELVYMLIYVLSSINLGSLAYILMCFIYNKHDDIENIADKHMESTSYYE